MTKVVNIMNPLTIHKKIFFIVAVQLPRLRWNQNMPLTPNENQLTKRALMTPSRPLNTGIPSAINQATSQREKTKPIQKRKPRLLLVKSTLAAFSTRLIMYLAATLPLTTPEMTIVGQAMPYAILEMRGLVEERAGEPTPCPM